MLGRTNLLFVAGDNTSELAFTPDYILTSASGNILKIEYINDLFFVFTEDEKVLYGSDMNNLQTLKNGNEAFAAKHIIYADGVYYLTKIEKTTSKAIIYKSSDLISYEVITLKTGTSSYSYPVHGLFLDSKGEIVALIEEYKDTYSSHNRYLLIVDTLAGYQEESASFIEVTPAPYNKNTTAIGTRLKKDRIFTYINASSSYDDGGRMISLDGTMSSVDMYSFFALDYFFKLQSHSPSRLYYSLNGTDYISLEFSNDVTDFNAINVFEYGGTIALIYRCTENEETVTKLTTAATPKELIKATASAIPVTIDYGMIANSNVYVDEYAYLGSTGGIVIKGKIDNAETERPDVVVVKGMAAKEALKQANDYTDEKYKTITKEVELHEETTKQYMENAFHATPEGYAELVDTVSENKVKIDTIIEKADLRIKADASGEEIHLTDSDDDMVPEFHMFGKIEQNTTTGKNLWDNSKAETNSSDVTKTETGITFVRSSSNIKGVQVNSILGTFDAGTTLSLSAKNTNCSLFLYKDEVYGTKLSSTTGNMTSCTLTEKTTVVGAIIIASADSSASALDIQAEIGTATEFEPYTNGASPNPQYQQPIEVSGASGSVAVKSVGKNLLDTTLQTKTLNGITISRNEDGTYTLNGTATNGVGFSLVDEKGENNNIYNTSPNGKYFCGNRKVSNDKLYQMTVYGMNGTELAKVFGNTDSECVKIAETENIKYIYIWISKNVVLNNVVLKPMITTDSNANYDSYEPYKETLSTIPTENGLCGIKVSSNGNYTDQNGQQWICDEIVKYADGSGERIQKYKKIVLDGINVPFVTKSSSTLNNIYVVDVDDIKYVEKNWYVIDVLCTHFLKTDSDTGYNNDIKCIYNSADRTRLYFGFGLDTELTTIEQANAWLQENNVTVIYPLAEPIRTPLTAEEIAEIEKLHTFYPITNISNDGGCGMKVTYKADSKNYIDRMVAKQVASIVANMNN